MIDPKFVDPSRSISGCWIYDSEYQKILWLYIFRKIHSLLICNNKYY